MSLAELLIKRIEKHGPISIADYMEAALIHPEYGYYVRKDPLGSAGDFITAPEVSQIFGELIGAWIVEQWVALGKPKVALAELGPGRGTLMSDILRSTKTIPGFHDAISVHLVEASPTLKQKQWATLAGKHTDIQWHLSFDELPEKPLLLVANEFFDALPIRQFIYQQGSWHERLIGVKDKIFHFVSAPLEKTPKVLSAYKPEENEIYEICDYAEKICTSIAARIAEHSGAALIIDYGYETQTVRADTLQALKGHEYHDVLKDPGTADITAHVDFGALKESAKGVECYGPIPQGPFLIKLGAYLRADALCEFASKEQKSAIISGFKRLVSPDQMGELFNLICIVPPGHPKPEGF